MSDDLFTRLHDEADLCANEGADDIARLLWDTAAKLKELRAEVERLRKDAERYRWVRITPTWIGFDADYRPDEVDAVVDRERSAALAEGKK